MLNKTQEELKAIWGYQDIPLRSFGLSAGEPLVVYAGAGSPGLGTALVDSEADCIRFEGDATPGTIVGNVTLPGDLDTDYPMTLQFLCSKSGATDADDTVLTVGCFITAPGALYNADSDCGGDTDAMVGTATAKTTALLERTIAAADIPASAFTATLTVKPKAGTLGTDILNLHGVRLKYKRTDPGIGG